MADSELVDDAVIAHLSEPTLAALLPDGVHYDVAAAGTKFVIVSQLAHEDQYMFGGTAFERFVYLVKAVEKATTTATTKAAAQRIHALLQDGAIAVAGYTLAKAKRIERVRINEVDDVDRSIRWQHRGGHYELLFSPN